MKKRVFALIVAFAFCAAAMLATAVQPALAQSAADQMETADCGRIAGFWANADSEGETLTITEDGYFILVNETEYIQGYLVYVDEYEDGNGRYDMFTEDDVWFAGFYQDSENSLHMGNDDGTVFVRTEESWEVTQGPNCVLTSAVQYTDMVPLYNDSTWNDGYFYSDMTKDGITVIVNCCAANGADADGTSEAFRKEFAGLVSGSEVMDYQVSQNQNLTEKFTYPVYDIAFTTGANEDTRLWKMVFFQTDTHTYAYAFQMSADYAESMEEEYWNAVNSLDLVDASGLYDPSANGESLEEFIAYFDNWYQYGDLNAESIRIYGDGTWEFYNSLNEDGTGGYLFDSGTFMTSGKTALQLYSADGSYVADVSLNEYGDLILTPVVPGYGNFYEATAFIRESESVAH